MATLKEIKQAVKSHFKSGLADSYINGKVKEMTNGADLRKKSTWEYALSLLTANKIEKINSVEKAIASKPARTTAKKTAKVSQTVQTLVSVQNTMRYVGDDSEGNHIYLGGLV